MQVHFTQGVVLLFSQAPDLDTLCQVLNQHGHAITAIEKDSAWPEMKGPSCDVETGGTDICQIDICSSPWPDDMGIRGDSPRLSSAYAEGAFGPFTQPGSLERALRSPASRNVSNEASRHQAFVRVRMGRVLSDSVQQPINPANPSDAMRVLGLMLRVATSITETPGVVAYFNPNGEILMTCQTLAGFSSEPDAKEGFPLEAICGYRGGLVEESWSWVDCVGLGQLGLHDHEFVWPGNEPNRRTLLEFMLALIHYQIDENAHVTTGHAADGPQGSLWHAEERPKSCMIPSRQVLHWTMDGAPSEPACLALYAGSGETVEDAKPEEDGGETQRQIDAWLGHRDAIRTRAIAWLRSPEFRSSYYDDVHLPPTLRSALEREMSKKEAADTLNKVLYMGEQTTALWNQYQQLEDLGQVWLAAPLMSNPQFQSKPNVLLPCALIVAPLQTAEAITEARDFAEDAFAIYSGKAAAQKAPVTARMLANDKFRLFGRESFPVHETQGLQLLFLSLMMKKSWMPPREIPFVPLLAIPGPEGAVIQIPWHVAAGTPPIPGSVDPGRFADMTDATPEAGAEKAPKIGCWHIFCMLVFLIGGPAIIIAILKKLNLW